MSLVTGYFDAHREGYGFVVTGKAGERDLFIPARSVSGAMNNDRVVARIEDRRQGEEQDHQGPRKGRFPHRRHRRPRQVRLVRRAERRFGEL
ncbi:MAG: hypothetical protein MZV70_34630 [Desulfobacterales bacterium]|nr:hypothetical protein [Desulfobacterales bacterium]